MSSEQDRVREPQRPPGLYLWAALSHHDQVRAEMPKGRNWDYLCLVGDLCNSASFFPFVFVKPVLAIGLGHCPAAGAVS